MFINDTIFMTTTSNDKFTVINGKAFDPETERMETTMRVVRNPIQLIALNSLMRIGTIFNHPELGTIFIHSIDNNSQSAIIVLVKL